MTSYSGMMQVVFCLVTTFLLVHGENVTTAENKVTPTPATEKQTDSPSTCEDIYPKCGLLLEQKQRTKEDFCGRKWPRSHCQRFCGICEAITEASNRNPPTEPENQVAPSAVILACTFEKEGLCGFHNLRNDKFDWTKTSGRTASHNTGPTTDHTTGTSNGHYLYIEASNPRKRWDNAILESPPITSPGDYCLTFWYHMFGSGVGSLYVRLIGANQNIFIPIVWQHHLNVGDQWTNARANFKVTAQMIKAGSVRLQFEGITTGDYRGDIAIDDIVFQNNKCPVFPYTLCKGGYHLVGKVCYGLFKDPQDWFVAQARCAATGGFLAEPINQQENDDLKEYLNIQKFVHVWLGGNDLMTEGKWFWSQSGVPITNNVILGWWKGEPNNAGNKEHCTELYYNRGMNDQQCNFKIPFVCQRPNN